MSRSRVPSPLDVEKYGNPYVMPGETLKDMLDQSSGSGSGLPLLVRKKFFNETLTDIQYKIEVLISKVTMTTVYYIDLVLKCLFCLVNFRRYKEQ